MSCACVLTKGQFPQNSTEIEVVSFFQPQKINFRVTLLKKERNELDKSLKAKSDFHLVNMELNNVEIETGQRKSARQSVATVTGDQVQFRIGFAHHTPK